MYDLVYTCTTDPRCYLCNISHIWSVCGANFGWIRINRLLDWKIVWIKSHGKSLQPPTPTLEDVPPYTLTHNILRGRGHILLLRWGKTIYVEVKHWGQMEYMSDIGENMDVLTADWNGLICSRLGYIGAEPHVYVSFFKFILINFMNLI